MKATDLRNGDYEVEVDRNDVDAFKRQWPASGIGEDRSFTFRFSSSNGNLVDMWAFADGAEIDSETDDGPALAALSEDAGRHGAEELELTDVLAIRYGGGGPRP